MTNAQSKEYYADDIGKSLSALSRIPCELDDEDQALLESIVNPKNKKKKADLNEVLSSIMPTLLVLSGGEKDLLKALQKVSADPTHREIMDDLLKGISNS
jgi:hypothetical protein